MPRPSKASASSRTSRWRPARWPLPDGPLQRIADNHHASPSQLALAWLLKRSPVMLPIPGTSKVAHLEENVAAAEITLSDDEFETLAAAGAAGCRRPAGNTVSWWPATLEQAPRRGIQSTRTDDQGRARLRPVHRCGAQAARPRARRRCARRGDHRGRGPLEKLSALLSPYDADEWASPSGRRMDLPVRGNILTVPIGSRKTDDGRIEGWARFARFHLGRNGAVHGGSLGMLFDTVLGLTASVLSGSPRQRTAYLNDQLPQYRADRKGAAVRRWHRPGRWPQNLRVGQADRRRHAAGRSRCVVRAAQTRPAVMAAWASGRPNARYKPRTAAPARRVRGLCVAVAAAPRRPDSMGNDQFFEVSIPTTWRSTR